MILELFITLCGISIILLVLGYFTDDPYYAYVGLFFFFLLGTYLFTNQLQYETGSTLNTTYTYVNNTLVGTSNNITYDYANFSGSNARWFGLLLSVCGGAGMAGVFFNYRRKKSEEV